MATSATSRISRLLSLSPRCTWRLAGAEYLELGFTIGVAQQPRERMIPSGDVDTLQQEITRAKQRFGLPEDARVVSCYEAGRDGFWLHRYLVVGMASRSHVIDSASIEVNRRQRRAKTDRLDVRKLLTMLLRRREEGVERGPRAERRGGRPPAAPPGTDDGETGPHTRHQSHQRLVSRPWRAAHIAGRCRRPT